MFISGDAEFGTPVKPYGPVWHAHRRIFQQAFNPRASLEYRPVQIEKVNDMLYSLLDSPEEFRTHIKTYAVMRLLQFS
jgi:cytochrome P450